MLPLCSDDAPFTVTPLAAVPDSVNSDPASVIVDAFRPLPPASENVTSMYRSVVLIAARVMLPPFAGCTTFASGGVLSTSVGNRK